MKIANENRSNEISETDQNKDHGMKKRTTEKPLPSTTLFEELLLMRCAKNTHFTPPFYPLSLFGESILTDLQNLQIQGKSPELTHNEIRSGTVRYIYIL